MEPTEIWARTFDIVRAKLAAPTVWLAMQAAKPLAVDGNYFVAALSHQDEYLESHLEGTEATLAIEEALRTVTGRVLAFRLIIGDALSDWEAQKALDAATSRPVEAPPAFFRSESSAEPPPAFFRSESSPPPAEPEPAAPPVAARSYSESTRIVSPTWERLNERLSAGYKSTPFVKYAHGQAQYVLTAVKLISDTMDVMMPPPGMPRDDAQERMLIKAIERLSGIINLDALFLSLELLRYRESQGKNIDIPF
jgi:hypothetical protein